MKRPSPYQPTLFEPPVQEEKKEALVLSINISRKRRDAGIDQAIDHAEQEDPGWSAGAYEFLLKFLKNHNGPFQVEEVRSYAALLDFSLPPSARAWGSVILKAAKAGLVKRVGYKQVRNIKAHATPAAVWQQIL